MHNYVISRLDQEPAQVVLQAIHAALVCPPVPAEDALVFVTTDTELELTGLVDSLDLVLEPYRYCEDGHLNAVVFRRVPPEHRQRFKGLKKWELLAITDEK